jgi:hypothetical protein
MAIWRYRPGMLGSEQNVCGIRRVLQEMPHPKKNAARIDGRRSGL